MQSLVIQLIVLSLICCFSIWSPPAGDPFSSPFYKKPLKGCKEREVDAAVDFFLDEAGVGSE